MRERFGQVIVLWFCLLVAAVITYNAVWYPWTGLGEYYYSIVTTPLGALAVGEVFYLLVLAFAAFTLMWAGCKEARRVGFVRLRIPLGVSGTLLAIGLVSAFAGVHRSSKATPTQQQPNVIVIGIDSLRLDQLKRFGVRG